MYSEPVDYSAEEMKDLRQWLEFFVSYETREMSQSSPESQLQLLKILAIIRGVDDVGKGTAFISEFALKIARNRFEPR
jgi:hypothetical protein